MQNRFESLNNILQMSLYDICRFSAALINKAEDAFAKGMVIGFNWNKKFSELSVFVKSRATQTVLIRLEKQPETLWYSCDCNKIVVCSHIVSAFIAVKYLFTAEYGHHSPYDDEHRQRHITMLLYGNCVDDSMIFASLPEGISICLFLKQFIVNAFESSIACYLIKDGKIMLAAEYANFPELTGFLHIAYRPNAEELFIKNINAVAKSYPLYLYEGDEFYSIRWDENFVVQAITEIDSIDDDSVVRIRRLGRYYGALLDSLVRIDNQLVLDKKTGILGRVISDEESPWHNANGWQLQLSDSPVVQREHFPLLFKSFEMKVTSFNTSAIYVDRKERYSLDMFLFKNNGHEVVPEKYIPQLKMTISHNGNMKSFCLDGEMLIEDLVVCDFDFFSAGRLIDGAIKSSKKMKTAVSSAIWLKGFFAAGCSKNKDELDATIKEVTDAIVLTY